MVMDNEMPSTVCPTCGKRSYNPNDIRERYCGFCHQWYSDMKNEKLKAHVGGFQVERLSASGYKDCELPLCSGEPATHLVAFDETGVEVLVCDRHATGIVELAMFVNLTVKTI